ncbi:ATP-binding protein [Rugamonas rubra]|uniref:AAA ATPase domain-containing protein n=1 Tax=Rugamonas rubra TaxID=758825 RepID=A0A1I4TK29_9BURK|nr:ATP-binding protein [Rugamonas rubra]SFM77059.1 hypothetical protein SAMN02982985_05232 [Rugamonas rubra]
MVIQTNLDDVVTSIVDDALESAIFRDTFNPVDLLSVSPNDVHWPPALRRLAEFCVEIETSEGLQWSLRPDARVRALRSLKPDRLYELAIEAEELSKDKLGRWLAIVILNREVEFRRLSVETLQLLRKAALYVNSEKIAFSPRLLNQHLERQDATTSLKLARSEKVLGRWWQLRRMKIFADVHRQPGPGLNSLEITGPGGSGKSALLAEFVSQIRGDDWHGSPLVWLDFDRVELSTASPSALTLELSRQIGLTDVKWSNAMNNFRQEVAETLIGHTPGGQLEFHSSSVASKGISSVWHRHTRGTSLEGPLILILDTLEEVAVQTPEVANRLEQWLWSLMHEFELADVRVIMAGRVLPVRQINRWPQTIHSMTIGNLPHRDAKRLLQRLVRQSNVEPVPYDLLVTRFGGNPLVLKLIANWINTDPHFAITDLTSDSFSRNINETIAQGLIYRRILGRMRTNDKVKKLAFPGLILRRVTPELIMKVLAEPCGLSDITLQQSEEMFNVLSSQVWLVKRDLQTGALLHRKDLRQLMLKILVEHDYPVASAIHLRAIKYYEHEEGQEFTSAQRELEARYHHLMLGTLEDLDLTQARALLQSIGTDISSAPLVAAARLKAQAQYRLQSHELQLLDEDLRSNYERKTKGRLSRESRDIPLSEILPVTVLNGLTYQHEIEYNVILDFFANANFEAAANAAMAVFERTFKERTRGVRVTEGRNLTESSLWQAALSVLVAGKPSALANYIKRQLDSPKKDSHFSEQFNLDGKGSLTFRQGIETILSLLMPGVINTERSAPRQRSLIEIEHIDDYRYVQLNLAAREDFFAEHKYIRAGLMRFLAPEFIIYLQSTENIQRARILRRLPILARTENLFNKGDFDLGFIREIVSQIIVMPIQTDTSERKKIFNSGLLTDLYPAVCPVLETVDPTLLSEFVKTLPIAKRALWPIELQADRLLKSIKKDRVGWIATFVECVDQHGMLESLIRYCRVNSKNEKITQIERLVSIVDRRFSTNY